MDYNGVIRSAERKYSLQPGLLASVWQQESGGSTDLGLEGEQLSRGRGAATGPFQIVPYYHPDADLSSFESQADYAAQYLKDVGVAGYYGTGSAPAGHPTTEQYTQQVLSRLPAHRATPQEQQMQNYQNPITASAVQGVMQPQEPPTPMMQDPMFWIQAAAGMGGGGGNPIAGIAQGFGQAAGAYQARNQMTPYERAKIDALREEAAMRQGISPLEQAKLDMQKRNIDAQERARQQMNPYQQHQVQAAEKQRSVDAQRRSRAINALSATGMDQGQAEMLVDTAPTMAAKLVIGGVAEPITRKDTNDMRKEFRGLPEIKSANQTIASYEGLRSTLALENNPVAAVASVVQLMKTLDPGSTVTQSEAGTIQGAGGPWEAIAGALNKAVGDGFLTAAARAKVDQVARAALSGKVGQAQKTRDMFSRLAERQGIDDTFQVIGDAFSMPDPLRLGKDSTATEPPISSPTEGAVKIGIDDWNNPDKWGAF